MLADDILHRTSPFTEAMEGIHTIMPVSGELHAPEQCDGKMQMHVESWTPASSVCSAKSRLFSPKLLKSMVLHLQHPVTLIVNYALRSSHLALQMIPVPHLSLQGTMY